MASVALVERYVPRIRQRCAAFPLSTQRINESQKFSFRLRRDRLQELLSPIIDT